MSSKLLDNRLQQFDCEQCRQNAGALRSYMIHCPTCGNKRCPKAQNHVYKCTGSNEVGQVGMIKSKFGDLIVVNEVGAILYEATSHQDAWLWIDSFGPDGNQWECILCTEEILAAGRKEICPAPPIHNALNDRATFEKWLCENRGYTKDQLVKLWSTQHQRYLIPLLQDDWEMWNHQQAVVDHLDKVLAAREQQLTEEIEITRKSTERWLQANKEKEELQKRVEALESTLKQIRSDLDLGDCESCWEHWKNIEKVLPEKALGVDHDVKN